ncbi:hypothetical protein OHB54_46745 (plasmid) [Streptomyces sp. NBC_01007]|nr:hypothetical protein OHB54_46745 [Streptomyces sp. NBC_01007]
MKDEAEDLSLERIALRDALKAEEAKAKRRQGANYKREQVIDEASRRLKRQQLPAVKTKTVSGWFAAGTPAEDFRSLWTVVQVLLEHTGLTPEHACTGPQHAHGRERWLAEFVQWKQRWKRAGTAPLQADRTLLRQYLVAATRAAGQHPYQIADRGLGQRAPALADVYIRQQVRHSGAGTASVGGPTVPAEDVFTTSATFCLLLGGPGGGKSSLLRTRLAQAADTPGKGSNPVVPVLVTAAALTGDKPLPVALAVATTTWLRQYGLLDALPVDFFRGRPRARARWLVLVDGLDELAHSDRHRVLQLLASAAGAEPALYRFVVATRPLDENGLKVLGAHVSCFTLQPFTPDDLHTYAKGWFAHLDDSAHHAQAFTAALQNSRLHELALIPLMATMLCQLYAADPDRPLPHGRSAAYEAFVKMLYHTNSHKQVGATHKAVIARLSEGFQVPHDAKAVTRAARRAREHLPKLIDYLAHQRLDGATDPAVALIATHPHAACPAPLEPHQWHDFLGELLRPTGLLVREAGDHVFVHGTFAEFHAARHATATQERRAELIEALLPLPKRSGFLVLSQADSYMGFTLDRILAAGSGEAKALLEGLDALIAAGNYGITLLVCRLVRLGTLFPGERALAWLVPIAANEEVADYIRLEAAMALTSLDTSAAIVALTCVADSTTPLFLFGFERARYFGMQWVGTTTTVEDVYSRFARAADMRRMHGQERVAAAAVLARLDRSAGITRLVRFAGDSSLDVERRLDAVRELEKWDRSAAITVASAIVDDTSGSDQTSALAVLRQLRRGSPIA